MIERRGFSVACLVGFLAVGSAAFTDDAAQDAAQSAAESWLALVDGGDYAASWAQAAKAFKGAVKQAEWSQMAGGARAPLGKMASRKLKSREYTEKAPTTRVIGGRVYTLGEGRYVILHYDAAFESKPAAVETITVMADPDGAWRVSGYLIR